MKVISKDIKPTRADFKVSAEAEDLKHGREHAAKVLSGSVKAPGFRPGKVPADMVFKYANPSELNSEFLNHIVSDLYGAALQELKLRAVGEPKIEVSKFVPFETVEVSISVPILGDIKLPDYKSLKVTKNKVEVDDKLIEENIKELQKRSAKQIKVNRAAKSGDMVDIDFEATDFKTQEKLPQASAENYRLMLGDKTFIPGFEEKVIGLSADQSKNFTITFPKDYHDKSFASRKVNFKVNVKAVSELDLPKVDDEFAKGLGPFNSVAELKGQIKKDLTAELERQAIIEYENQLLSALAEKTAVAIDEELVELESEGLIGNAKQSATNRGQTWEEFLASRGQSEKEYEVEVKKAALERIRGGVAISEIAVKEGIDISDSEIDGRITALKRQYKDPSMLSELDNPANRREIGYRMLTEKVLDFIQTA